MTLEAAAFSPQPTPVTEVELFSVAGVDGYLRQVNARFAELLGVDPERLEDRSLLELVHPDDLPEVVAGLAALAGGYPEVMVENRFRRHDDDWVHLQWVARPLPGTDLWWAAGRDTTSYHRWRAEGADLRARLDLATGHEAATWELRADSGLLLWDASVASLLATDADDAPTTVDALAGLVHQDDAPLVADAVARLWETGQTDVDLRLRDDRHVALRGTVSERDRRGRPVRAIGLLLDVTTAKAMEEHLLRMVLSDGLTGAPNRRAFDQTLRSAWRHAATTAEPLSLLMVDVDNFKKLNDTFGHLVGDQVLIAVWRALDGALHRSGDAVARFGGEEFAVALPNVDPVGALAVADRLCAAVREVEIRQAPGWRLSVSIGAASRETVDAPAKIGDLLARADEALYVAKGSGKDRAVSYESALADRARLEDDIRAGLERDEFVLHYQPIVSVETGAVSCFEALLRWERPGHGLLRPSEFIPAAERSDLIVALDRRALLLASQQAAQWRAAGLSSCADAGADAGVRVAVNLSGRHAASPAVVTHVLEALEHAGLPPTDLTVELTETAVADSVLTERHLTALREHGVAVAIDDFGTGSTSLGQLPQVPADVLKVDHSLIASLEPRHQDLVGVMVAAAHAFGVQVVAEGVESPEVLDGLRDLGCDLAQGYLIARPVPAAAVPGWLADRAAEGTVPGSAAPEPV